MKTTQASLIVVSVALALAMLQPLNSLAQGEPTSVVAATDAAKKDAQLLKIASPLEEVADAYHLFSSKLDGCIKPVLVPPSAWH